MNVKMPNGQIVNNVPEGTTKQQLADKWSSFTGEKIDVALFVNPDKTTDKTLPIVHRVSPTNRLVPGGTLQEIDDSQAKLKDFTIFSDTDSSESYKVNLDSFNKTTRDSFDADFENPLFKNVRLTVGDVLDYPELYKTSPYIKDMVLNIVNEDEQYGGYYQPLIDEITINTNSVALGFLKNERAMFKTLIHEIQHVIEEKEYLKHKQKGLLLPRDVLYANEDYVSNEVFSFKAEQRTGLSSEQRRIKQMHPMIGGFEWQRDERLKHDLVGRGYHRRVAHNAILLFEQDILHRDLFIKDLNVSDKQLTNFTKKFGQPFIVKNSKNFIELNGVKLDVERFKMLHDMDSSYELTKEQIDNSIARAYVEEEYAKENSTNSSFQEQDFTRKLSHIKDKYIKKDSKIGSDLNIDLVGNIYNTTKDPNNNKWLELAKTRKPKSNEQLFNITALMRTHWDYAKTTRFTGGDKVGYPKGVRLGVFSKELETLKNRGYSELRIRTMLRPIIAAESNFGVDTNNKVSSDVAGQMQVKYSTFQDLFNKKYLGNEFSKATGITQKDLKNMTLQEFKKLMNEDQKFDHLVGIGALLQKLKNHSDN